jgi:hypothetical protein
VRGGKLLVAAVVAMVAALTGACQAIAGPGQFGVVYASLERPGHDLDRIDRGGVGYVRWPLFWSLAEPKRGRFDWTIPDRIIGDFASRGIRVLPALYSTPRWAGHNRGTPPLRPRARKAWKGFLRAAVRQYGPGGRYWTDPLRYQAEHPAGSVLPIRDWQVWNEPNLDQYFSPRPSARKYGRLVSISHDALKAADPHAHVILAGMPGLAKKRAWRFLANLYRVPGIKHKFDGAALHPYAPSVAGMQSEIREVRAVMAHHGDRRTPLWLTEIGWGSASPRKSPLNKGIHGQKRMLRRAFELLRHRHRRWHVPHVFWYDWRDPAPSTHPGCSFCTHSGLIRHGGRAKPSWHAFRHFAG